MDRIRASRPAALDPAGTGPQMFYVGLRPGLNIQSYENTVFAKLGPGDYHQLGSGSGVLLQIISGLVLILTLLLVVVAALGVLNTVAAMTRERVHDLGVFKAIGMTPRQTIAMVVCSVAGIGLVAGLIAIPAGIAVHNYVLPVMGNAAQTALLLICRVPGANKDDFASRLNDSNPKAVLIAAMCLGLMKDPRAVPVLESMMNSNDPETRLGALKALGETSDPSVIPILRQTLKDSDVNMRGWSIIGLGNLQDKGSIADLTVLANDPTQPSTIQSAAAAALRHISNDDAAPTDSSTPSASSGP